MKRLVPFEVEGHLIYVKVEEVESGSQAPVFRSGGQDVIESKTASRFVDAIETVKPSC